MAARSRLVLLMLLVGLSWSSLAWGQDALVLPKGRSSFSVESYFYLSTDERYNPSGNPESIASNFDGRRLDSTVFPALRPLDPFVGGSASIGDSQLHFKYNFNIVNLTLAHGITDRLTVGVEIPFWWVKNDVTAYVNSALGSSANVGLRTGPGPGPLCGSAAPVLPLACPNTRRFTTEDVQRLLTVGLPGIPGFGLLEENTNSTEQVYLAKLTYSTVPAYRAGDFPLPVDIALTWRDRFAGSGPESAGSPSQILKTQVHQPLPAHLFLIGAAL